MTNEIFEKDYTYSEIFENLKKDDLDDFTKISSIINIEKIENSEDFKILIYHLTNHPTPIREIVAIKLEEISKHNIEFFVNDDLKEQLLNAVIDINPNVSRAICSILENNEKLVDFIFDDLILKTKNTMNEIKEILNSKEPKTKKSHAKNKKVFAFYWFLEAISSTKTIKNNAEALEIVNFALDFPDYTIREKGAKILTKIQSPPLKLLQKAKSDQNFYVKNLLCGKIDYDE